MGGRKVKKCKCCGKKEAKKWYGTMFVCQTCYQKLIDRELEKSGGKAKLKT